MDMNISNCSFQPLISCDYLLWTVSGISLCIGWFINKRYADNSNLLKEYNRIIDEQILVINKIYDSSCAYYTSNSTSTSDLLIAAQLKRDFLVIYTQCQSLEKVYPFFSKTEISTNLSNLRKCITGGSFETTQHYEPDKIAHIQDYYKKVFSSLRAQRRDFGIWDKLAFIRKS